MKYKVGDKVRIKSLDWYNENSDDDYNVVFADGWHFSEPMSIFCGKDLIIEKISHATNPPHYMMKDNTFGWTDEMIEGLMEEETKPNIIEEAKTYWDSIKDAWICPEGYIFKDENGNVINAMKIVLEKKKKEYPKTFEECCKVLELNDNDILETPVVNGTRLYGAELWTFYQLLICRDAYWKIAGEEMGLGKPWEPSGNEDCFVISRSCGEVYLYSGAGDCEPFEFPTAEMRDAFKENFDPDIEFCKELL